MSLPETLPHLVTIKESDNVPDEFAGADWDDPTVLYEDIPAWVQPAGDREIKEFQRRDQNVTHKIYFSRNLDLRPGYIIVPSSGPFTGKSLEVKSANECTAGTGLLFRVMVEETQPR